MAHYCIGDLHGRKELFDDILNQINFDSNKDHVYLLGDVINHRSGGVKILQKIMKQSDRIHLILGNHELYFLSLLNDLYVPIMANETLKSGLLSVLTHLPTQFPVIQHDLFQLINNYAQSDRDESLSQVIQSNRIISKWVQQTEQRHSMFYYLLTLIEAINYDLKKIHLIERFISTCFNSFQDQPFKEEILALSDDEFQAISTFLSQSPKSIELTINERSFALIHDIDKVQQLIDGFGLIENRVFVFGHHPVPSIHKQISHFFNFNKREILSYKDRYQQYFYNLDLNPDVVGALRLEDFEEFYTPYLPASAKNKTPQPSNLSVAGRKIGIKRLPGTPVTSKRLLNFNRYALEYLIEISTDKSRIDVIEIQSLCRFFRESPTVHTFQFETSDLTDAEIVRKVQELLLEKSSEFKSKNFFKRLFKSSSH